ncbi:hypothetical protein SPHI_07300 [Sphingomonas jeddahensis]|uniref:Lipoprotein n=2 Tax=Sphingomonas jeddahensis TaxID=1915074 RepID=A0A1V2EXQ9_9SPHN|nr:hypothetical protein SPHI_07300 [Sphingomonas jeddahensis]
MSTSAKPSIASARFLAVALLLGSCGKIEQDKPVETAQTRAEAKRHKDACASGTAYDRMKRVIFDEARKQSSHRTNLDTLEAFSIVRMEGPVVEGRDPTLDVTRCRGRFILDVPPGSEQALGGERRLSADIAYTAQDAADGSGLVYVVTGAEPIVSRLAAFDLSDATYRPLPALDADAPKTETTHADERTAEPPRRVSASELGGLGSDEPEHEAAARGARTASTSTSTTRIPEARTVTSPVRSDALAASAGEGVVRTFYNALGAGRGEVASAQVIPEKRSSRAYSADAISRFYGRLPEPLRLTSVSSLSGSAYRVTYRYAAPGLRCNGSAIVRLTSRESRPLIRSITASNGC